MTSASSNRYILRNREAKRERGSDPQVKASTITAALFSAYYPSHGGGLELSCADLSRALANAGIAVDWLSHRSAALPDIAGTRCTPLSGTDLIYELSGIPLPLPAPWTVLTIAAAVKRADLTIVAEANFILSVVAFWVARWYRKPILVVQHVGKPSTVSRAARLVMRVGERIAVRPMLRRADAVVCVSPVVARHFADLPQSRFVTLGHGVDVETFRPPVDADERASDRAALGLGDGHIACFVGRLTRSKGIDIIAGMARRRPDWTFAIAGIGPIDPSTWGLGNVIELGQLDRHDTARLIRASNALILPSPSESFSLVVREAMASNCRVLCSPQILETDPGLVGYIETEVVDIDDPDATSARFAMALDRPVAGLEAGARAYIVEHCSPKTIENRYIELVGSLVADATTVTS